MMMMSQKLPPLLAVMFAIVRSSLAVSYTVGGTSGGWGLGTDLQTWASTRAFWEGDELVFQYSPGHDVSEVTKADFGRCQSTSPIHTFSGGSTVIPLTSPGKRYFICSVPGHCSAGMKLEINTLLPTASPVSISTPPTAAPTSWPLFAPPEISTRLKLPPASLPPSESPNSQLFSYGNHLSKHSVNSKAMKLVLQPTIAGILSLFLMIILGM